MLNQYLTNIYMMKHNLETIHFNVVGPGAYDLHVKTGEWGRYFSDYYDTVAERIKMLNGYPISSLREVVEISKIKEVPSKGISVQDALNIIINDFKLLNSMNKQVADYATTTNDLYILSMITDIIKYLDKAIWLNTLEQK